MLLFGMVRYLGPGQQAQLPQDGREDGQANARRCSTYLRNSRRNFVRHAPDSVSRTAAATCVFSQSAGNVPRPHKSVRPSGRSAPDPTSPH
eukprot:g63214.t1